MPGIRKDRDLLVLSVVAGASGATGTASFKRIAELLKPRGIAELGARTRLQRMFDEGYVRGTGDGEGFALTESGRLAHAEQSFTHRAACKAGDVRKGRKECAPEHTPEERDAVFKELLKGGRTLSSLRQTFGRTTQSTLDRLRFEGKVFRSYDGRRYRYHPVAWWSVDVDTGVRRNTRRTELLALELAETMPPSRVVGAVA